MSEGIPEVDTDNLISQIIPLSENNKTEKSVFSKKNEEEVLTGLLSYLETNIQQNKPSGFPEDRKTKELNSIKSQIQKYLDHSKDRPINPEQRGKLLDVMASFGKVFPGDTGAGNFSSETRPTNQASPDKRRESQEFIQLKKFESLENKYQDLMKLNQETQLQIKALQENKLAESKKRESKDSIYSKKKSKKNNDLFKKMHEASIEMVVNRESQLFSTQTKEGSRRQETGDMSGSSHYIHSKIDKIYQNEDVGEFGVSEEKSVKLSGKNDKSWSSRSSSD